MDVFNKVALQSLKKNRARTIVTVIGVALSAAMVTAAAVFGVSLLHYMINGAAQKYGGWHAAFLDADASFVQQRIRDPQAESTAVFENIGCAVLEGGKNPEKPYLFIAGFSDQTFETLPITLLSGRLPENSGEILVSGRAVSDGGVPLAAGDTLALAVGNRMDGKRQLGQNEPYTPGTETFVPRDERAYTVSGICQTPAFEADSMPGYTVITRPDAEGAADRFSLFVTLKNPRQVHSYAAGAADGHAAVLNNAVLRFMGLSDDPSDAIFNALLYAAGGIVIAIIMIGSVFLIYNAFSISLNERTQQIGILASVGATQKQLRHAVLFEGLCIGAAGIPLGILTGIGSMWLVISVVAGNFQDVLYSGVPLTLKVSVPAIAGAAAASITTILISAYIPAKKAAGMPVMACIRQTDEVKVESKALKTSELVQRVCGLEGVLALKNFKRNQKRVRSIVLSLVLSIVLFISSSAFVMDLKQASEQAKVVTDYDIGFGTQEMDDSGLLQLYGVLKNAGGVTGSSYQAVMTFSCAVKADCLTGSYWASVGGRPADGTARLAADVQFLDDGTYRRIIEGLGLPAQEYTGSNGKMIAVAKMLDGGSQAEGIRQMADLFANPDVDLAVTPKTSAGTQTGQGQAVSITFVETVPPDMPPLIGVSEQQPYCFQIMAPWPRKDELASGAPSAGWKAKGLTFQSETPSRSAAEMETAIQGAGIPGGYILLNTSKLLEESRNMIFIANVFAYTFIVMISLIAAANVFNTISTNIKLRRQELAMLRSVGMSERDFDKMMRFECAFYGIRALAFGLPLAALSSWLIYKGMFIGGAEHFDFVLPWASIGISVCSVLLVIFATMLYAAGKIKKENIIDALRDDMA